MSSPSRYLTRFVLLAYVYTYFNAYFYMSFAIFLSVSYPSISSLSESHSFLRILCPSWLPLLRLFHTHFRSPRLHSHARFVSTFARRTNASTSHVVPSIVPCSHHAPLLIASISPPLIDFTHFTHCSHFGRYLPIVSWFSLFISRT